jgi:hypothetical protein
MSLSVPNSKTLEPIKLSHGLCGWPPQGPNAFRWEGGQIIYSLPNRSHDPRRWDKTMTPTAAQWEEFWRVCDEIDVWSWPPLLGNMMVCDGLQWVTELEIGSRRMNSMGQVHGSPPGFSAKLMRLHRALQAMAGWQPQAGEH